MLRYGATTEHQRRMLHAEHAHLQERIGGLRTAASRLADVIQFADTLLYPHTGCRPTTLTLSAGRWRSRNVRGHRPGTATRRLRRSTASSAGTTRSGFAMNARQKLTRSAPWRANDPPGPTEPVPRTTSRTTPGLRFRSCPTPSRRATTGSHAIGPDRMGRCCRRFYSEPDPVADRTTVTVGSQVRSRCKKLLR